MYWECLFKFNLASTTNLLTFCQPANAYRQTYIAPICIIARTLLMFSARGCAPDISPGPHGECIKKYCPLGNISQYTPCSWECTYQYCPQGQYFSVHSLGRTSGTHPRAENIDNVPAMMQINSMQTFAGKQNSITLVVPSGQNLNNFIPLVFFFNLYF